MLRPDREALRIESALRIPGSEIAAPPLRSVSHGVAGRAFTQSLRPTVEDIRREVFGSAKRPFRSRSEARRWIESSLAQLPQGILTGWGYWESTADGRSRPLYGESRWCELARLPVPKDMTHPPPVLLLALELSALTIVTDLPEHAIVDHILAGAPIPRVQWTLDQSQDIAGGRYWRSEVTIVIPVLEDLTAADLSDVFLEIRQTARKRATKSPSNRDLLLLEIVSEIGQPPAGAGAGKYWRRVLRAWKQRAPREQRGIGACALQMRWGRIKNTPRRSPPKRRAAVKQRADGADRASSRPAAPARRARPADPPMRGRDREPRTPRRTRTLS